MLELGLRLGLECLGLKLDLGLDRLIGPGILSDWVRTKVTG